MEKSSLGLTFVFESLDTQMQLVERSQGRMEGGAYGIQALGKNGTEEPQSSFPVEIKGSRERWLLLLLLERVPGQLPGSCGCPAEDAAQSPCPVASAGRAFPRESGKFGSLFLFIPVTGG